MKLSDFDYKLPKSLIAQQPVSRRDQSRLMVVEDSKFSHKKFCDIMDYLMKDDILVVNETKVDHAKLVGRKSTGAKVEVILMEDLGDTYKCRISRRVKVGNVLVFGELKCDVISKEEDMCLVRFFIDDFDKKMNQRDKKINNQKIKKIIKKIGILPTPPYVKKELKKPDTYQTVYSKKVGSLAAPTAGLHFTDELLGKIRKKGVKIARVCLHVGFGTFLPIREEDFTKHELEKEYFCVDQKNADIINNRKGRLFVVGTTSMKCLESCSKKGKVYARSGYSNLFIYPGYKFKLKYDGMITNFHLPKSSLILMVSAYYGWDRIKRIYIEAVKKKYRFYSFGDGMLLM